MSQYATPRQDFHDSRYPESKQTLMRLRNSLHSQNQISIREESDSKQAFSKHPSLATETNIKKKNENFKRFNKTLV